MSHDGQLCGQREKCISSWLHINMQFPSPLSCYQPNGKGPRLPEVYCVISRLGCFDLFSKVRRYFLIVFLFDCLLRHICSDEPDWKNSFLWREITILQLLFWILHLYYLVHQRMSYYFCDWGRNWFRKHLGVCMIWLTEVFSIVFYSLSVLSCNSWHPQFGWWASTTFTPTPCGMMRLRKKIIRYVNSVHLTLVTLIFFTPGV